MRQYRTFWLLLTMMLLVALTACTNGDDNPVGPSSDNLPSDESVLHFFIAEADTRAMIMGLSRAPQGVVEWSTTIDDMFEISNNVGAVSLKDGEFIAEYLVRGFVNEKVNSLANEVIAAYDCANTGFTAVPFAPYSSWNPDINSPLMNYAQRTYQQYFGNPITLRKVGGGLELSVFAEVYPDMQCISFGPTILDAHSINERVDINSIHDCWRYTLCLLKDFTFI